jgi:hypothetical protein
VTLLLVLQWELGGVEKPTLNQPEFSFLKTTTEFGEARVHVPIMFVE